MTTANINTVWLENRIRDEDPLPMPYRLINKVVLSLLSETFDRIDTVESRLQRKRELGLFREGVLPKAHYKVFYPMSQLQLELKEKDYFSDFPNKDVTLHFDDVQLSVDAENVFAITRELGFLMVLSASKNETLYVENVFSDSKNDGSINSAEGGKKEVKKSKSSGRPSSGNPKSARDTKKFSKTTTQEESMEEKHRDERNIKKFLIVTAKSKGSHIVLVASNVHRITKIFEWKYAGRRSLEGPSLVLLGSIDMTLPPKEVNRSVVCTDMSLSKDSILLALCFSNGSVDLYKLTMNEKEPCKASDGPFSKHAEEGQQESRPFVAELAMTIRSPFTKEDGGGDGDMFMKTVLSLTPPRKVSSGIEEGQTHSLFLRNDSMIQELSRVNNIYRGMHDLNLVVKNRGIIVWWEGKNFVKTLLFQSLKETEQNSSEDPEQTAQEWILPSGATCLSQNQSSDLFCVGTENGCVMLCDTRTGTYRNFLVKHNASVVDVGFLGNDRIASFAKDGSVHIHDIPRHGDTVMKRINLYMESDAAQQLVTLHKTKLFLIRSRTHFDAYDSNASKPFATLEGNRSTRSGQSTANVKSHDRRLTVQGVQDAILEYLPEQGIHLYLATDAIRAAHLEIGNPFNQLKGADHHIMRLHENRQAPQHAPLSLPSVTTETTISSLKMNQRLVTFATTTRRDQHKPSQRENNVEARKIPNTCPAAAANIAPYSDSYSNRIEHARTSLSRKSIRR